MRGPPNTGGSRAAVDVEPWKSSRGSRAARFYPPVGSRNRRLSFWHRVGLGDSVRFLEGRPVEAMEMGRAWQGLRESLAMAQFKSFSAADPLVTPA
jgi:hypothetical protein